MRNDEFDVCSQIIRSPLNKPSNKAARLVLVASMETADAARLASVPHSSVRVCCERLLRIHNLISQAYRTTPLVAPSYHDVVVTVNGVDYEITKHSDLLLSCTRTAGWELRRAYPNNHSRIGGARELVGGEYMNNDFRITVKGTIVCDRRRTS